MHQDSHAVVKLEVALGTVLDCYARDRGIEASIKPKCLCNITFQIILQDKNDMAIMKSNHLRSFFLSKRSLQLA